MPVTVNGTVYTESADGSIYGQYPLGNAPVASGAQVWLADFNDTTVDTTPGSSGDLLWQWDDEDASGDKRPGSVSIELGQGLVSANSLGITVTDPAPDPANTGGFFNFYNHDSLQGKWYFLREEASRQGATWELGKYNRMRLWVKVNSSWQSKGVGREDLHIGTYLRENAHPNNNHSGGSADATHWYHYFKLKPTTEWQQVIVDIHPNHRVGGSGSTEHYQLVEPVNVGQTYFDNMTYWYFDQQLEASSFPQTYELDGVELFQANASDSVEEAYSMNGVYDPNDNSVYVAFSRLKPDDSVTYDVRYAFSSFHDNGGFTHGLVAGTTTATTTGGYNLLEFETTSITMSTNDVVYIAVRKQGSTPYREIAIPVTSAGYTIVAGSNQ